MRQRIKGKREDQREKGETRGEQRKGEGRKKDPERKYYQKE